MERVLRLTRWSVVLVAIASAGVARAAYDFVSVDYPGAQNTQLWDINNSGLAIVRTWREFFREKGVEQRSIEMLEQAILPPSFFLDRPPDPI